MVATRSIHINGSNAFHSSSIQEVEILTLHIEDPSQWNHRSSYNLNSFSAPQVLIILEWRLGKNGDQAYGPNGLKSWFYDKPTRLVFSYKTLLTCVDLFTWKVLHVDIHRINSWLIKIKYKGNSHGLSERQLRKKFKRFHITSSVAMWAWVGLLTIHITTFIFCLAYKYLPGAFIDLTPPQGDCFKADDQNLCLPNQSQVLIEIL